MKNKDKFFYDMMRRQQEQSTCRGSANGAVIEREGRIIAAGWNSPPGELKSHQCKRCDKRESGEIKSGEHMEEVMCIHAEQNAILQCARYGISSNGTIMYTNGYPCPECSRSIVGSGIIEVVYFDMGVGDKTLSHLILESNIKTRKFNV